MGTAFSCLWSLLYLNLWIPVRSEDDVQKRNQDDTEGEIMLIFAYVAFAIGAVLIVAGFARLIWWAWTGKQYAAKHRGAHNPNFYTYYKDPWLRAPSMASLASGTRTKVEHDNDSLRVDTDAIYAQPVDATTQHGIYISPPPTEQELSQTESQIYAEAGGNGSGHSGHIYSVPHKYSSRGIPVTSIDEESDVIDHAPSLPTRSYITGDVASLTEVDRMSMRELGYVEPPRDYSPAHSSRNRHTNHESAVAAQVHAETVNEPNQLSGGSLYHTAVFRDNEGTEVSRFKVAPHGGSMKSMKSLYQYMISEEPCALDNEIDYTYASSIH